MKKLAEAVAQRDTELQALKAKLNDVEKAEKTYHTATPASKVQPSYMRAKGGEGDKQKYEAFEAEKEVC